MKDHTKDTEMSERQAEKIRQMVEKDKRDLEKTLEDTHRLLEELLEKHQEDISKEVREKGKEVLEAEKERARRIEEAKSANPSAFYVATVQTMEAVSMSLYLQYRTTGDVPQGELKEFQTLARDAEQLREEADPETVEKYEKLEIESEKRVDEIE